MENKYLTVSALNKYLAYKFETDSALRNLFIKGEISNFRISKGHLYFSLKDDNSEIKAIMFNSDANNLKFIPVDGMKVLVTAQVSIYQKGGTYNLTVSKMEEAGLGESYLNFLRLKERLEKEGLFAQNKKLSIPKNIEKIGVITSLSADALQDILSTINKRFPLTKVFIYPALVQGLDAPKSIISALNKANEQRIVDVIIIARGGGSSEDLSCFNDEALARAVFSSKIPTVSGVGHESDFTIVDFVASLRAPTPTGAAVLLTKDQYEVAKFINDKTNLLKFYFKKMLENKYYQYQNIANKYHFKNFIDLINQKEQALTVLNYNLNVHSPLAMIESRLTKIDDLTLRLKLYNIEEIINEKVTLVNNKSDTLNNLFKQFLKDKESHFSSLLDKMIILNPLSLMKKGYTLTYQNEILLTSVHNIRIENEIKIKFHDGEVMAKPLEKLKKE